MRSFPLNSGYQFMGVATPETNPGTPDQKVFYIANGKGTYTNFGEISITEDEVVILYYDTAWHKLLTGIASQEKLSELDAKVTDLDIEINGVEPQDYSDYQIRNGYITPDGSIAIDISGLFLQMDITGFIPVKQGDKFVYRGLSSKTTPRVCGYTDLLGTNPITLVGGSTTESEEQITIPQGVNYIVAWSYNANHSPAGKLYLVKQSVKGLKDDVEALAADGAVTTQKIADHSITSEKLDGITGVDVETVIVKSKNLLDPTTIVQGYIASDGYHDGNPANFVYVCSQKIPVSEKGYVTAAYGRISSTLYRQIVLDTNNQKIRVTNDVQYIYQEGDAYVIFCYYCKSSTSLAQSIQMIKSNVAIVEGAEYEYEEYFAPYNVYDYELGGKKIAFREDVETQVESFIVGSRTYKVLDASGKGDFVTLSDAIKNTPKNGLVLVMPGVYDIRGLFFNKGQSFIGIDKEHCIFRNPSVYHNSPFCFSGYYKNITWEALAIDPAESFNQQNYVIHIDAVTKTDGVPFRVHFDNCRIYNENGDCFGCGAVKGLEIIIERCEIELNGWMKNAACFSLHNVANVTPNGEYDGAATVKIYHSILKSNRGALRLGSSNMQTPGVEWRSLFELVGNTFFSTLTNPKTETIYGKDSITIGSVLNEESTEISQISSFPASFRLSPMSTGNNVSWLNI